MASTAARRSIICTTRHSTTAATSDAAVLISHIDTTRLPVVLDPRVRRPDRPRAASGYPGKNAARFDGPSGAK